MDIMIVNNSNVNLSDFEVAIVKSLRETGSLPEELADLFVVTRLDGLNEDGSPRWIIDAA